MTLTGTGEDWLLSFYSRPTAASALSAWNAYFADSAFQQWKAKFGWNNIRLLFRFTNMYNSGTVSTSTPINTLDGSSASSADIVLLDQIVQICANNGFQVMLDCYNFTGHSPTEDTNWTTDLANWQTYWANVATHFSGDSRVSIYEIANELKASTLTNSALMGITSSIRQVDATRAVAWWTYSPSNASGGGTYAGCPIFANPGNIYADLHVSTYINATTCSTNTAMQNALNGLVTYQKNCGYLPLVGEINAQNNLCNSVSVYLIEQGLNMNLPWIAYGYHNYKTVWDSILANVTLPLTGTILITP